MQRQWVGVRRESTSWILSTWHLEFRADQSLLSQFLHLWGNGKWHWSQHLWELLYTGWVAFGNCNFNWLMFFQSCTETISTFPQPEVFGDIKQFLYKTRNLGREGRDHHERYRHHQWSSTRTSSLSLNIFKDTESLIALNELSGRNDDMVYPQIVCCSS